MRRIILLLVILVSACEYDFPLTEEPTRHVDPRFVGSWIPFDPEQRKEMLNVVVIDEGHYAVLHQGELSLAHHSDIDGLPLVSARLCSGKYAYFSVTVSEDGKRLTLMQVNDSVIPAGAPDVREVVKLIRLNRDNPLLFKDPFEYERR